MSADQLVTVGSFTDPMQAHIAGGRLESEGIPVTIADEYFIWANWMLSNALGGVKVQVPANYEEQARKILSDIEQGEYVLEEDNPQRCPRCHSQELEPLRTSWRMAFLGMLVYMPVPFRRDRIRCRSCGHIWSQSH